MHPRSGAAVAVEVGASQDGARTIEALEAVPPGTPPLGGPGWLYLEMYAAPCPADWQTARVLEAVQRAAEMRGRPTRG